MTGMSHAITFPRTQGTTIPQVVLKKLMNLNHESCVNLHLCLINNQNYPETANIISSELGDQGRIAATGKTHENEARNQEHQNHGLTTLRPRYQSKGGTMSNLGDEDEALPCVGA